MSTLMAGALTASILGSPVSAAASGTDLSTDFGTLMMQTMQHGHAGAKVVFAGTVCIDGQVVGRPAKRRRRMSSCRRLELDDQLAETALIDIKRALDSVQFDAGGDTRYTILLRVLDPCTQQECSDFNVYVYGLIIQNRSVYCTTAMGYTSPVRTVVRTAMARMTEIDGICSYLMMHTDLHHPGDPAAVIWLGLAMLLHIHCKVLRRPVPPDLFKSWSRSIRRAMAKQLLGIPRGEDLQMPFCAV
jgi:hypothetical protein